MLYVYRALHQQKLFVNCEGSQLNTFITSATSSQYIKHNLIGCLTDQMGFVGPLCDSAIRVIQANQARLPKEVEHLIASVHTLSRVSDCIKRQEEGKSHGGLLELSTLVEQAAKARELTPKLLELRKADKESTPRMQQGRQNLTIS